jgi:predicted RNA-binding Zn-ribbon protein involved in translation (DUF1610 family)
MKILTFECPWCGMELEDREWGRAAHFGATDADLVPGIERCIAFNRYLEVVMGGRIVLKERESVGELCEHEWYDDDIQITRCDKCRTYKECSCDSVMPGDVE